MIGLLLGPALVCLPLAQESATSADWFGEADQAAANFGWAVSSAGDVNGDGFDDVIIGAPRHDNGEADEGRTYLYLGSATGLRQSAAWTAESDQAEAWFGASVSAAGDVNGDGFANVIVGAARFSNGQPVEGRAFVYHGSAAGLAASPAWVAESDQAEAWFGWQVATAGDVNGDGFDDVLVGAPSFDNGEPNEGRVFVFLGSSSGLDTSAAWTAEPDLADSYFGHSLASAGDVNGDGFADVIIGAYGYSNGQFEDGRAFLYHGSAAGLAASAAWTAASAQSSVRFGRSVCGAGDINADGFDDVLIGAPWYDGGEQDEGRVSAFFGSLTGLGNSASWTTESDQVNAQLGRCVSRAGDVDGDGFADVIAGAHLFDNGEVDEGRALVFHGSSSGLAASAGWTAESDQPDAYFGRSVADAGDINGDGLSDVIVGAYKFDGSEFDEGRAFVFHGNTASASASYCTAGTSASGCSAQLSSTGLASATAPTGFVVSSSSLEGQKSTLLFFAANGRQANTWGNGTSFQCVTPPVQRAGSQPGSGTSGQCDGAFSQDLNALWCPACPKSLKNPGPGALVQAQLWYRDPQNTSNQSTSLSDAIEFLVAP